MVHTSAGQQMAGQQVRLQDVRGVWAVEPQAWGLSLVVVSSFLAVGRLGFCYSCHVSGMEDILSVVVSASLLVFFFALISCYSFNCEDDVRSS